MRVNPPNASFVREMHLELIYTYYTFGVSLGAAVILTNLCISPEAIEKIFLVSHQNRFVFTHYVLCLGLAHTFVFVCFLLTFFVTAPIRFFHTHLTRFAAC